jgi:hypothetical protein
MEFIVVDDEVLYEAVPMPRTDDDPTTLIQSTYLDFRRERVALRAAEFERYWKLASEPAE